MSPKAIKRTTTSPLKSLNIHLPCYCTVRVMLSFIVMMTYGRFEWKRIREGFCRCPLIIYVLPLTIQLSRGETRDSINRFNPGHLCACLKTGPAFLTLYVLIPI
jgi:hypothetical protein